MANSHRDSFVLNNVLLPNFETRQLNKVNIEVMHGKIKRISTGGNPLNHTDMRDGQGQVILPAMIDMHSHSMGNSSLDRSGYQYIGIRGTANAMLYAGVHGWLDLFSNEQDILSYRDENHSKQRNEAFVFAAGPCFTVPNGHCDFGEPNRLISTPEDARRELIDLSKSSPNVVKVVFDNNPKQPTLDKATLKAFLQQANALNIKSVVHIGSWRDAQTASEFGANAITHLPTDKMPEGLARLLAKNNTAIIPTVGVISELLYMHNTPQSQQKSVLSLDLTEALVDEDLLKDYPVSNKHPRHLAWLNKLTKEQAYANMQNAITRLNKAGVTIFVGSDSANLAMYQGVGFHRELFHLQQYGLPAWQLFESASVGAYQFLGLNWQLEVGAPAHFTLHDAAIFDDVSVSTDVTDIYLYGRKVERAPLLNYAKPGFIQYAKLFLGFER